MTKLTSVIVLVAAVFAQGCAVDGETVATTEQAQDYAQLDVDSDGELEPNEVNCETIDWDSDNAIDPGEASCRGPDRQTAACEVFCDDAGHCAQTCKCETKCTDSGFCMVVCEVGW